MPPVYLNLYCIDHHHHHLWICDGQKFWNNYTVIDCLKYEMKYKYDRFITKCDISLFFWSVQLHRRRINKRKKKQQQWKKNQQWATNYIFIDWKFTFTYKYARVITVSWLIINTIARINKLILLSCLLCWYLIDHIVLITGDILIELNKQYIWNVCICKYICWCAIRNFSFDFYFGHTIIDHCWTHEYIQISHEI